VVGFVGMTEESHGRGRPGSGVEESTAGRVLPRLVQFTVSGTVARLCQRELAPGDRGRFRRWWAIPVPHAPRRATRVSRPVGISLLPSRDMHPRPRRWSALVAVHPDAPPDSRD